MINDGVAVVCYEYIKEKVIIELMVSTNGFILIPIVVFTISILPTKK